MMPDPRPSKPGRINCGGLYSCRRTFDASKEPEGITIICGRCWRTLPADLRHNEKSLKRQLKRMRRLAMKPDRADQANRLAERIEGLLDRAWDDIRLWFRTPSERPEGIEAFLEEMNL